MKLSCITLVIKAQVEKLLSGLSKTLLRKTLFGIDILVVLRALNNTSYTSKLMHYMHLR